MTSRFSVTSNGLSRPGRTMVRLIVRAGRAAHLVDRLVERAAVDQLAVEMGDIVARLDAGAEGRRILGRRDDLDRAVLHGDGEAEAAIGASVCVRRLVKSRASR